MFSKKCVDFVSAEAYFPALNATLVVGRKERTWAIYGLRRYIKFLVIILFIMTRTEVHEKYSKVQCPDERRTD